MKDPVYRTASPYPDPNVKGPKSQIQAQHRGELRKSKTSQCDELSFTHIHTHLCVVALSSLFLPSLTTSRFFLTNLTVLQ